MDFQFALFGSIDYIGILQGQYYLSMTRYFLRKCPASNFFSSFCLRMNRKLQREVALFC